MSLVKVKEYFKQYNMDNRIIELNESSATVEDAAHALCCEEKEIAKDLGISRSYVKKKKKRAITKILREFIKNEEHKK